MHVIKFQLLCFSIYWYLILSDDEFERNMWFYQNFIFIHLYCLKNERARIAFALELMAHGPSFHGPTKPVFNFRSFPGQGREYIKFFWPEQARKTKKFEILILIDI